MRRPYQPRGYGPEPDRSNFWRTTVAADPDPVAEGDLSADVAIVGAGFTGLNAAHELANFGMDVMVLDAVSVGFGASGRNGGFCCLGGDKLSPAKMIRRYGAEEAATYRQVQRASVDHVAALLDQFGIDADRHSNGETLLAHRPGDAAAFANEASEIEAHYGVKAHVLEQDALGEHGLAGPGFHGALTIPVGFALNPLKYLTALADATRAAGARIKIGAVRDIRHDGRWTLVTPKARIRARKLIIATNGFSADDLPDWMADRFLPAQSAILVTRPLSDAERTAQGFTSAQMCYDTRRLLHYFRLLPDGRFLFGMRGSTSASALAARSFKRVIRRDFEAMFPAWSHVETPHYWGGFVCLTRALVPFAGPLAPLPDAWGAFGYHGNGVAMGSYSGRLIADMILGQTGRARPRFLSARPRKFGLGRFRRHALKPAYAAFGILDR